MALSIIALNLKGCEKTAIEFAKKTIVQVWPRIESSKKRSSQKCHCLRRL